MNGMMTIGDIWRMASDKPYTAIIHTRCTIKPRENTVKLNFVSIVDVQLDMKNRI